MAWFKVDDKLHSHTKWLAVPPRARGLWVTAGSWSAANETDGRIPRHAIRTLGGTTRDAAALVEAGLWREVKAGWIFHEWSVYQPDAASLKAKRRAEAEGGAFGNHRRWHAAKNVRVPGCPWCDGMPPDEDAPPLDETDEPYRVPDQGGEGVPESPPNRPVPEPDTRSTSQVGGGGGLSNAQATPPPPTPEILNNLQEPWRCPIHQGRDEPCHHCKAYKTAHKTLEAQRVKDAKDAARAAQRERERTEEPPPLTPDDEAKITDAKAKALAAAKGATK